MFDTCEHDCRDHTGYNVRTNVVAFFFSIFAFYVQPERAVLFSSIAGYLGRQYLSSSKSSLSYLGWQLPFIVVTNQRRRVSVVEHEGTYC